MGSPTGGADRPLYGCGRPRGPAPGRRGPAAPLPSSVKPLCRRGSTTSLCREVFGIFKGNAFLLDVRSEEEYEESNIPNSKLLNIRDPQSFMDGLQDLDKSKNFYVYCHSGVRSVQACQIMKTFGFNNLYNLLGGISE